MKHHALTPQFVEFMPSVIQEGIIYISMPYVTAVHKCCCGCGQKVVTPFGPTDWKLIFDGDTVSLRPSIGNWSSPCQSHYWIEQNIVRWAPRMSREQIAAGRVHDRMAKQQYYESASSGTPSQQQPAIGERSVLARFRRWFDGL
jgi:hypothetical protein